MLNLNHNVRKMSKPSLPLAQRKVDGDWTCATCSNMNYSFRSKCNRCHSARPLSSSVFSFALFSVFPSFVDEVENIQPGLEDNLPSLSPYMREKCMKERTDVRPIMGRKLDFGSEEVEDWKPKLVQRGAEVTALPSMLDGVKRPYKEKTGDWVCLGCKNLNFAFRQQCNKCHKTKASYISLR